MVVGVGGSGEAKATWVGALIVKGEMTVRYQCEAAGLSKSAEALEGMVRKESCRRSRWVAFVESSCGDIGVGSDVKIYMS